MERENIFYNIFDFYKKKNITFQVIKKMEKSNKEMLKIMEQNRTVRLVDGYR